MLKSEATEPLPSSDARHDADILFVIGQMQVGGAETHLATVIPKLVGRGWRSTVFCFKGDGPLRAKLERGGVPVLAAVESSSQKRSIVGRLLNVVRAAWSLLAVMVRRRPKIVHFFLPEAYVIGAPLAVLARAPIRVMSRRSINSYQKAYVGLSRLEPLLHRTMTAVLGNSRRVVRELLEDEGVPERRLGLIYNGVDLDRFTNLPSRASVRARLGIPETALVMVMVANLIPYKGHLDLMTALAEAHPQLPSDWRCLVVGRDDGAGPPARAKASELGIEKHVMFLGPSMDVPELLAACDIGLLTSHQEGFSNAVLEGMAAGLPMVVTNVGGNAEAILDGEMGIVVPPRDPHAFSEAIVRLANDPRLREEYGSAAKKRVAERFALDACVAQYEAFYNALLSGKLPSDLPGIKV